MRVFFVLLIGFLGLVTDRCSAAEVPLVPIAREGLSYSYAFEKDIESTWGDVFRALSGLEKNKERLPQTVGSLKNRIEKDVDRFLRYFASIGYLDADVSHTLSFEKGKHHIVFNVIPGARFTISEIEIHTQEDTAYNALSIDQREDILILKRNDPVDFNRIALGSERLEVFFKRAGFPFVKAQKPQIRILEATQTISIRYDVALGPRAMISSTHVEGLKNLAPSYVENRVLWKNGDMYDQRIIDKTRRKLLQTGLVGSLSITPIKPENTPENTIQTPVQMKVQTSDALPRIMGAGVRFATSEGFGGRTYWNHNNLQGGGEHLGVSLKVSKIESQAKVDYNLPDFLSPEQKLLNSVSVTHDRMRAYRGRTDEIGSTIQHPFLENVSAGVGVSTEKSRLVQDTSIYRSTLFGVPLNFACDQTEDLLNPLHGFRINARVTPYRGRINAVQRSFSTARAGLTCYLPFAPNTLGDSPLVMALFVRGGSVWIKQRDMLPPNKRFYAGGGDSVRAYGAQLLGPLSEKRIPLGGRSLAECGGELRIKTSESIGWAIFTEAGSVTDTKMPDYSGKKMLWGGGVGFRYYTSIGPIRVDLALPYKQRKDVYGKKIDAPFQFYISIGQAF